MSFGQPDDDGEDGDADYDDDDDDDACETTRSSPRKNETRTSKHHTSSTLENEMLEYAS